MKLLLLAAFVLPSLVPTGFMAQRSAETGQLEIALCPSGFSQFAINALSSPESAAQSSHHGHHQLGHKHLGHKHLGHQQPSDTDHSSHHEGGAAELCPLAGPGAIVIDFASLDTFSSIPVPMAFAEQPLVARAQALLPPPVRGPPTPS